MIETEFETYVPAVPKTAKQVFDLCAENKRALTFDDCVLEPQYSEIEVVDNINLESFVTPLRKLKLPIIAAPMDMICESEMAIAMGVLGGLGIIHRYMSLADQVNEVEKVAAT